MELKDLCDMDQNTNYLQTFKILSIRKQIQQVFKIVQA